MKKSLLATFMLFGMVLTGCNKSSSASIGGNLFSDPKKDTESALTSSFIAANVIDEDALIQEVKVPKVQTQTQTFARKDIVSADYSSYGLLIVKNSASRLGFYSILHGDYLIAPKFEIGWTNYNVVTGVNYVGFILNIQYEDKCETYDGFGNALIDKPVLSASSQIVNKKVYLTINNEYFYEYSDTGVATSVDKIPEPEYIAPEEDPYKGPKVNDLFTEGRFDLDEYGYANHSILITEQGYYTTFENNTPVVSFYVATDFNYRGLIGSKMIFQRIIQTAEDTAKYNFTRDNNKYSLETLLVDFLTGEKVSKDVNVVIQNITPLKQQLGGTLKYSYVTYYQINKNALVVNPVGSIVDENFVIHDDASGMAIDAFIKLSNGNFFNTVTKILYDQNMQIITSLAGMNVTYLQNMKIFKGRLNGLYGLVNEDGKVVAEFRYTDIYSNYYPGHGKVIVTKDYDAFRLSLNTGSLEYVGTNISVTGENLFTNNVGGIFSSDENLITGSSMYTTTQTNKLYLNKGERVYEVKSTDNQSLEVEFNVIKNESLSFVNIPSETKGTEDGSNYTDGSTSKKSVVMNVGVNKVHTYYSNGTSYAKFTPTSDGYYSFYVPSTLTFNKVFPQYAGVEQELEYINTGFAKPLMHDSVAYVRKSTAKLVANMAYIIQLTHGNVYQQLYNMVIEKENGTDEDFPLEINGSTSTIDFVPSIFSDNLNEHKIYAKFKSNALATYNVEAKKTGDTVTATVNGYSIGNGIVINNGDSRLFTLTFKDELATGSSFAFIKTAYEGTKGYDENIPFALEYKQTAAQPEDYSLAATTTDVPYAYYRFRSPYGGTYGISMSFSSPINVDLYNINSNGQKTFLEDYDGVSSFNYAYNSASVIEPTGYILVKITLQDAAVEVNSYTLSSPVGFSYENPSTSILNYYSNSFPLFFTQDLESGADYYITHNSNATVSQIINGNINRLPEEKVIHFSSSSLAYFRIEPGYYTPSINIQRVYVAYSSVTLGEVVEFDDFDTDEIIYHSYTNSSENYEVLSLTLTGVSAYRYGYNVGEEFINPSSYNYSYGGTQIYNNIVVQPGETLRFFIQSESLDNSGSYCVSKGASIDMMSEDEDNNLWTFDGTRFTSGNSGMLAGSPSVMSMTFAADGEFTFYYNSNGQRYYNYLVVKLNGEIIIDCSSNYPTTTESVRSIHVSKDDVITFEYVKKNDSSYNNDNARVRIYQFVPDPVNP